MYVYFIIWIIYNSTCIKINTRIYSHTFVEIHEWHFAQFWGFFNWWYRMMMMIPVYRRGNWRFRRLKWLVQSVKASKWQSWDWSVCFQSLYCLVWSLKEFLVLKDWCWKPSSFVPADMPPSVVEETPYLDYLPQWIKEEKKRNWRYQSQTDTR